MSGQKPTAVADPTTPPTASHGNRRARPASAFPGAWRESLLTVLLEKILAERDAWNMREDFDARDFE
jgi:hypothetical protein